MVAIFVVSLILLLALVQAQTPVASDIQAGKEIWQGYFGLENDCKPCHGARGVGGFAKPLAGHLLTTAQFINAVRQGPGTMPAFVADKNLNDQHPRPGVHLSGKLAESCPTFNRVADAGSASGFGKSGTTDFH